MSECYVCYDPCDTLAPCLCKTMHVHPSCITIMKLYGKTECGICRTPYPGPPVEFIPEMDPTEEGTNIRDDPPCLCFIVPTLYRRELYHASEMDKFMDIFRYLVFFIVIMMSFHIITYPDTVSIENDWIPSIVMFTGLTCCCNAIGQTITQRQRNLHPLRHRADVIV